MLRILFVAALLILAPLCGQAPGQAPALAESPPTSCSFETLAAGELRDARLAVGRLTADPGHAAITDRFAHTGKQCLHLLGGDDRTCVLTLARPGTQQLSFHAERWTRREPFVFRIDALEHGEWREVYNGDAELRVGRRFLTHVSIAIPAAARQLRFRSTSPPATGVLIDDLGLAEPQPMRLLGAEHAPWTAPALHGVARNPITKIALPTVGTETPLTLTACTIALPDDVHLADIARVTLHYDTGDFTGDFAAGSQFGKAQPPARRLTFTGNQPLQPGTNQLWVAIELSPEADLRRRVEATCTALRLTDPRAAANAELIVRPAGRSTAQRIGVAVRTAGQDGCHTTRIPGLATTHAGTLIAVYDNRYRGAGDLPGDIDVGMSRSTDGGRSWQPMRVIMDMGNDPEWQFEGIGDPAVLVDERTGRIWVAATWSHGDRSWNGSGPGLAPTATGQLMLVHSDDDGKTWSEPINITSQIKDPSWRFVLQGPGAGITTRDGTLVFAAQYRSADDSPHQGKPFSTLICSQDRGATWQIGNGVEVDTTEAQLVELADGTLMINCRDNRGGARSVYTTRDLGRTWQVHPTSRSALPEPVCMASLLRVEHERHGVLLVFSNPATTTGRHNMTLKVSRDEGLTWPARWHTLYDQRPGYGYSCLTRVDDDHVGVLYEGRGDIYFLRVAIADLLGER